MLFSSYIVIRTTSSWMRSCPITRFDTKKPMSKNCPVLSLVLHLHHEACWCSEFWKQFLTVIQGQKKLFTVISTCTLCQSDGREYSLYMRAWLTVFTLRWCLATLMMPLSAAGRLWEICCINDTFPATRAECSKTGPKCSTSGEWDPYPATQAAKASFTAFLHHFRSQATKPSHAVNERTFFSSAKVLTLRESPLSLAKNTKTWAPRQCQRRAICPQQPNIFLTSNDDDVDQSWKQGSFHWFLPRMPSDQKNGGSTLDAPRFAGRKELPLKLFSLSLRLFEQKLCSPFCTEMIRPDGA